MRKSNVLGEELGRTCKLKIHLFRFHESRRHKWEKVMCEVQQELLHVLHSCTLAQTIGAVIVGQQRHSVAAAQLTCIVYGKSSMSDRDPKMGLILHRLKPAFMHNPCHFSSSRTSPVVSSIMQMSIKPWASNVCLLDAKPATVSMITTFPFGSRVEIASFARFKILTQSSSPQLWSTNCNNKIIIC